MNHEKFQLSDYIYDKNEDKLAKAFAGAAARTRDNSVILIWDQVLVLFVSQFSVKGETAKNVRSNTSWMIHVVESSVGYLQKQLVTLSLAFG